MKTTFKVLAAFALLSALFFASISCKNGKVPVINGSINTTIPLIYNGDTLHIDVSISSNQADSTLCLKGAYGQFAGEKCVKINY